VILSPATGTSARNGDRIVVQVRATDDLGIVNIGYRAQTGKPQDAANQGVSPAATDRTDSFVFFIPADAAPGAVIRIDATTVDTKGQVTQAAPIELAVEDAVAPTVAITGLATGAKLRPGQQATAVVSAQDIGGIASITFRSSGATASEQTRPIDPALPSVAAAFSFTIPPSAQPGDVVNLDAIAVDRAGNTTAAARLILPIIDEVPPTIALRTSSGSLEIAPGSPVTIIADVEDEIGVTRVDLAGDGAFTVADARQISPPLGSAQATFTINVPAGLAEGSVLNLRATATDISNNVSTPATLTLTVRAVSDVTLPASVIVIAGQSETVQVTLPAPAPAGGLTVTFSSRNATVAQPAASAHFNEGETSASLQIDGIAGGVTTIDAFVGGVQRASMTATVRGGVVSGRVLDELLNPVAGAQVTIIDVLATPFATVTDGDGNYFIEGVNGGSGFVSFTIRALNPTNGHIAVLQRSLGQPGGFAQLNLIVIAAGSVRGAVLQPDGQTPVGAGVRIDIFRPNDFQSLATTFTNEAGEYEFPLVTLGSYAVEARAIDGGRGRASIAVLDSGETVDAPITLLGRGTVVGTVLDGANQPVPNAELKFSARTVFGYEPSISVSAQPDGTFSFENVQVGEFQIEARNPVGGAAGSVSGRVDSHLQQVTTDVVVASYATLQGTVYRSDGVTPVPNADVSVGGAFGSLFTRTDEQGRYRFDFVRLGTTRVDAYDRGTSGRGSAIVTLTTNGQVVTQNITMVGQGSIIATVVDFTGAPVSGAVVQIQTFNELSDGAPVYGVTGVDGRAILERILVGRFRALAWAKGLLKVVEDTLAADEVKALQLQLQPTASVAGLVYEPDGQTPATAGHVYVTHPADFYYSPFFPIGSAPIAADGTFRIDDVPLGSFNVSVRDPQGRLRALVKNVVLSAPAQVASLTLTEIGLGTVNGRVLNPDSSSAPNLDVEVRSLTPAFGNVKTVKTDAAGFYEATEMIAGPFTVSTGDASRQLLGEGAGTLEHGQTVTVDVLLQNNAIALPINKWDGNNQIFQLQRDGSIAGAGGDLFSRTFQGSIGGMLLDVVVDGTANRFAGAAIGTVEEGGREVVTRQQGLGGLNVTRKAFVPRTGYFGRYLEILTNPTAAPITVDVRVSSILPRWAGSDFYRLVTTSSGDAVADISTAETADRWLVMDDDASGAVATAFAFDGPDAAERASVLTVEHNPDPACQFLSFSGCYSQRVLYQWNSITIEPGASVAFMHFLAQQRRQTSAVASAERLAQLPPEALVGLSEIELGLIRNFAIPEGGNSAVQPLPSLLGTITGTVYETDGVTLVRSTVQGVRFNTLSPLYDVEQRVNTDAQGRFTISASLSDFGNTLLVPAVDFTLVGRHPTTNLSSPAINASFVDGEVTTTQDVVFSQSALLRGFVRRHNDVVTPTATLSVVGPNNLFLQFLPIATDGSYVIGGLPPGTLTVTASLSHPQGSPLQGTKQVQANAGDVIVTDVTFPPTGSVAGVVRTATDAVAPNVTVRIQRLDQFGNPIFTRSTITDTSGGFLLSDAPADASIVYRIEAIDPVTTVATRANVLLVADVIVNQNLQLTGSGTVQVDVAFAGGAPANAFVTLRDVANIARFVQANATGRATILNVPVGAFTVEAQHPTNFAAKATGGGTLAAHGQVVPIAMTLPATGSVQVQVFYAGGAPAQGATIELATAGSTFFQTVGSTDANGRLTVNNVLGGATAIRARHPRSFGATAQASGVLNVEGQALPLTATLPAIGKIELQVNALSGSPVAGSQVQVTDAYDTFPRFAGVTDANGRLTVDLVRGSFDIQANDPVDARFTRNATGAVQTEGQTIPITIVLGTRGTVHGTVFNDAGFPTGGSVSVTLLSDKPQLIFNAAVAPDGTYTIPDVPTGRFRVRATTQFVTPARAGAFAGTVSLHGESVSADVHLTQTGLPAGLVDANAFRYDIDRSGSVSRGALSSSAFLQVGPASNPVSFVGDFLAAPELGGRQLVIQNTTRSDGGFPAAVGGATVTRKVYVPSDGYFIRYLDILENPTASPVTVTVRLQQALTFTARVVSTSSGDEALTLDDRWMILRDLGVPSLNPAVLVFQGEGAALALGEPTTVFSPERPFVGWRDVTLAPGERAIFLHFAVNQTDLATAQAAAERLVLLPPEALAGIDAADRPLVRNFAVPADGSSAVAPFGTVSGQVLTAESMPVPRAVVLVGGSASPLYKPVVSVEADAQGRYVANTLDEGPFTVQARDPLTGVVSPVASLSLDAGQTDIAQDLIFAASGTLRGTVRFAAGQIATSGSVRVTGGVPAVDITVPIGGDGTYALNVLAPGTYSVIASVNSPIFRFNTISGVVVNAGAATVVDISLRAQVDLRVTLSTATGAPAPGLTLQLIETLFPNRPMAVSDANGVATFTSVGDGPFTLHVFSGAALLNTFNGTVLPGDDGRTVDYGFTVATSSIAGTVRLPDGTMASSGFVQISPDGFNVVASASIAPDGTWSIPSIQPGSYRANTLSVPGMPVIFTDFFTVVAGQPTVVDIKYPAIASVRLTARQSDGTPMAGLQVQIQDAASFRNAGSTSESGEIVIPNVTEGPFTVYVYTAAFTPIGSVAGAVTTANHGGIVDVLFEATAGSISGQVYGRDGTTPLADVFLQLRDGVTDAFITSTSTAADGSYSFANVLIASGVFKIVAFAPNGSSVQQSGALAAGVVVDLTLPVVRLPGTVTYHDGTPAAGAAIAVAQPRGDGTFSRQNTTADAGGGFTALVGNGEVEVQARDQIGMLEVRAIDEVTDASTPIFNLVLPPAGTASGAILDALGQSTTAPYIIVTASGSDRSGSQFVSGSSYAFAAVPAGGFSVQACDGSVACTAVTGRITSNGEVVIAPDAALPAKGTVTGTVYAADGVTPQPFADVMIAGGSDGAMGQFAQYTNADPAGAFVFNGVPVGPVKLVAYDQAGMESGLQTGTLGAGAPLALNVQLGTAVSACFNPDFSRPALQGADGFQYTLGCTGDLIRENSDEEGTFGPYQSASLLRLNGAAPTESSAAQVADGGRTRIYGPFQISGVAATRKVFVPESGGFVRFLDTLTNSSSQAVTLDVTSDSDFNGIVHVVVDPATTGNTYAVTRADAELNEDGQFTRSALGHVFGGVGADVTASAISFQHMLGSSFGRWTVTIPAGQSVSLMHFSVQRDPDDVAGAAAQAQALVNLTDPNMLANMTAEEKARVVNFRIP
jgi:hypothetical protein